MKVLITGTSNGMGKNAALKFLSLGHIVYGIDIKEASIDDKNYHHYVVDIKSKNLPEIKDLDIIINNAGSQNNNDQNNNDIENNLVGTINLTEFYLNINKNIKSILFNASASSITGAEFSEYAASKAGIVGYMKNLAIKLAGSGTIVNAISFGGVITDSNKVVMEDSNLWQQIMDVTPLKKWTTLEEASEWIYFLTVINHSATGENFLVDNGEAKLNQKFIWKKGSVK